jgi:hypothetical protein
MVDSLEVTIDVADVARSAQELHTRATVTVPAADELGDRPVVCFGFPGGGYSRQYFTFDMPGASGGGQAGWHASRGWVFVSCDHLFVGESDAPEHPDDLTFEILAAVNAATVEHVWSRLLDGALSPSFPALADPVRIGIGQSMGGCLTIVQQGRHGTYDGIGILGYSARHTVLAMPPGTQRVPAPYVPRGSTGVPMVSEPLAGADRPDFALREDGLPISTWGFHYDDEPSEVVRADMADYPTRGGDVPVWGSATIPPCATSMMSPGVVAPEASVIKAPVLVAVGERDVCPYPLREPEAYAAATDVTVFICPTMSHMHNFASTREVFWRRIESWGNGVASSAVPR